MQLSLKQKSFQKSPEWRQRDGAEVTLGGNAFHARAPATGSARSPSEDRRVARTTTSVLEAERSLWREWISDTSLKSSEKYSGPRPWRQRCTRTQSLKWLGVQLNKSIFTIAQTLISLCFVVYYNICNVYVNFITVRLLWATVRAWYMPSCPVHVSLLLPVLLYF